MGSDVEVYRSGNETWEYHTSFGAMFELAYWKAGATPSGLPGWYLCALGDNDTVLSFRRLLGSMSDAQAQAHDIVRRLQDAWQT